MLAVATSRLALALCLFVSVAWSQVPDAVDPVVEAIQGRIDVLATGSPVTVEGTPLDAPAALQTFYERHAFRPFWDGERIGALLELIRRSSEDGLSPNDYHLIALERLAKTRTMTPLEAAQLDLLATDAYATLLNHLYFGKVDPVKIDATWNFEPRRIAGRDSLDYVFDAITKPDIAATVDDARPHQAMYRMAMEALAKYRHIEAAGGWPRIAAGTTLKPGVTDSRVALLRARLLAEGEDVPESGTLVDATSTSNTSASMLFDAHLEAELKRFQTRHVLTADGAVGPATLHELNVTVAQRIDQIRVNLERGRWVLHDIGNGDLVIVDVAGFEVRYLHNGAAIWRSRVQVGQPYRQTPIFKSAIDHIVLNPTWTVPPGILAKDILPAIRKDPDYLAKRGLRLIDRDGRPVNAASVDFSKGKSFPYMVRQDPGPTNALGRVKIMFPNPYLVYLHDTPSKSLFERDRRAFSSGCVRVDRPFELVELLLAPDPRWTRDTIAAALATDQTRTIRLPTPVPILILYWTIDQGDAGIIFKPDPYGRDPRLLKALNEPLSSR
jgi:murein L,D-transpeptidase YcbB/YkuD